MYHIKRAIILAAGTGERMRPITLYTPKPLVKVNGERMIETAIRGLHANGIYEIYVVTGYLNEQFTPLEQQYKGLKIIFNPYYNTCNNISSLYMVKEYIEDVIIMDGDQIIYNPRILNPDFEYSGYNVVWTEQPTSEWLLTVENNIVTKCSRTGGSHGWQLFSVSRWNKEDGHKLQYHLTEQFENKKNTQIYWDDIALFCYPQEYHLGIWPMQKNDLIEIDNLEELASIDAYYQKYLQEEF